VNNLTFAQHVAIKVSLVACIASFCACTTPRLAVQSKPDGADVYAIRGNQAPVKLGATPLNLTKDSNADLFSDGAEIRVTKDGFASQSVLIPKSSLQTSVDLNLNLQETKLPASCSQADQIMNDLAQGVARAQYQIFKKDYAEAKSTLNSLSTKYPGVAALDTLLGNIYYLDRDLSTALNYYQRAQRLQPENAETNRMVKRINEIHGKENNP
jgi:tetratricopeptide (TPR) repeat protein